MYYAIDNKGHRIHISNAVKSNLYYCPLCKCPVIMKEGSIVAHHFAHRSNDYCDPWREGKMSKWHCDMQSLFPERSREVIVYNQNSTEIHIADILLNTTKGNHVFEFQHSPISPNEFVTRSRYYLNLGYHLHWVFDFRDPNLPKKLYYDNFGPNTKYCRIIWPGKDRIKLFKSEEVRSLFDECTFSEAPLSIWFHVNIGRGIKHEFNYSCEYISKDYSKWSYLDPLSKEEAFIKVHIESCEDISDFYAAFYSNDEFKKSMHKLVKLIK